MKLSSFEQQLIQSGIAELFQIKSARRIRRKDFSQDYLQILQKITNFSIPLDLLEFYEEHKRLESTILFEMDPIDLEKIPFSSTEMIDFIKYFLTPDACRNASAIPLYLDESSTLHIGMVDPTNLPELDHLTRLAKRRGVSVKISLILYEVYAKYMQFALDYYAQQHITSLDRNIENEDGIEF